MSNVILVTSEMCIRDRTNIGKEPYTVAPFERIAQMVLAPVCLPELRQVAELDATERGTGGFGSTGK